MQQLNALSCVLVVLLHVYIHTLCNVVLYALVCECVMLKSCTGSVRGGVIGHVRCLYTFLSFSLMVHALYTHYSQHNVGNNV